MSIHLHWYLPTNGDSRAIVGSGDGSQRALSSIGGRFRPPSIEYLSQVAQAADDLGFEAALTPTGTWCEDAWLTTAALSQVTRRLKFLVAFRPGLLSPTLAAHQAATFQRISAGRLLLNVVTGGDAVEQRRFGDHLDHEQRYERTAEFLRVLRGVGNAREPFNYAGEHFRIDDARIDFSPYQPPSIFFGGASAAAERVAAELVDTYLAWGETPSQIRERIERVGNLAAEHGRTLDFGIRFHVISRETSEEAWSVADRLLSGIDEQQLALARKQVSSSESVGQQRMNELHGGTPDSLEIYPNVWAGYGLVRAGAGTAIVGSHKDVADRIEEYHDLGITHFIFSGQPHLEEAYHFGEGAAAVLRERGLLADDHIGVAPPPGSP